MNIETRMSLYEYRKNIESNETNLFVTSTKGYHHLINKKYIVDVCEKKVLGIKEEVKKEDLK